MIKTDIYSGQGLNGDGKIYVPRKCLNMLFLSQEGYFRKFFEF